MLLSNNYNNNTENFELLIRKTDILKDLILHSQTPKIRRVVSDLIKNTTNPYNLFICKKNGAYIISKKINKLKNIHQNIIKKIDKHFSNLRFSVKFYKDVTDKLNELLLSDEKLTKEANLEISKILKAYDDAMKLREQIIMDNNRIVVYVFRKYFYHHKKQINNLLQEGFLALTNCVDHYNPEKNIKPITYMINGVRFKMLAFINKEIRYFRKFHRKNYYKILKARRVLKKELGHEPTVMDILNQTKLSKESYRAAIKMHKLRDRPFNKYFNLKGEPIRNSIKIDNGNEAYNYAVNNEIVNCFNKAYKFLCGKEKLILDELYDITNNFKNHSSHSKVGLLYNCSGARIGQLAEKAINKMKFIDESLKCNLTENDEQIIYKSLRRYINDRKKDTSSFRIFTSHFGINYNDPMNENYPLKVTKRAELEKQFGIPQDLINSHIIRILNYFMGYSKLNYTIEELYRLSLKIEEQ